MFDKKWIFVKNLLLFLLLQKLLFICLYLNNTLILKDIQAMDIKNQKHNKKINFCLN